MSSALSVANLQIVRVKYVLVVQSLGGETFWRSEGEIF